MATGKYIACERDELRERLKIATARLDAINALLLDPNARVVNDLLAVVAKYGAPEEINAKAAEARRLPNLLARLAEQKSPYLADMEWLIARRDAGAFVTEAEYRRAVLGNKTDQMTFRDDFAVTLEISAAQYFPWLIEEARQAIAQRELMPGRFIRVRKMKESEADQGDLLAFAAAMQVMGASYVETLDTRGTDGSNVHLGGPATITGYFGGVGQPNDHVLQWVDEFLYYYTTYGTRQVLNVNPGTVLAGYLLHKLGVDIEFKISVFMGNDNPYATLWTLLGAKLFSRDDGSCPLIGFNLSNSVNNETIELTAEVRRALGFEEVVRIEHHITETWKSIVIQPYNRRDELIQLADHVPNISAKHEGGEPEVDSARAHPSDILDYFRAKEEAEAAGDMPKLLQNYLDKHAAVNATARALTEHGLSFVAARELHHRK
jgi:bifunctional DNA-binding transcriptional regulator/antitoxin component of YhaV-PrlF toxin-antitoxin module